MTEIVKKKVRNSNLELYRIIVMLLIVAHHYVVNSGLFQTLAEAPLSGSSIAMFLFGAWGKTGINCFVLITGYFMCKSSFTWKKLLKLYLQIVFYGVTIYLIFFLTGHETFRLFNFAHTFFPVYAIGDDFTSCFLLFYLFIPFLNIAIQHLDKRMHGYLVILLISIYTVLPSIPTFVHRVNYIEWFIALYFIASYLRLYSAEWNISHKKWGYITIFTFLVSCLSVIVLSYYIIGKNLEGSKVYLFVSDSNKILALATAITSFMWFNGIKMKYYPWINAVGATTFGVLLIHAHSDTMRQWLWKDTVDCLGHFEDSVAASLGYAFISVLLIFFICSFIEWLRIKLIENYLLGGITKLGNKILKLS